jgi:prepilin-type N-terminal cleavage/methylation domain-containing protein
MMVTGVTPIPTDVELKPPDCRELATRIFKKLPAASSGPLASGYRFISHISIERIPMRVTVHPSRSPCQTLDKPSAQTSKSHSAFTLVELLVVTSIIGILVALLLPAVQAAREAARQMQCRNNLKQLALACHNYENIMSGLPLLYSSSSQLGWVTQVLPFFEQQNVYDKYDITLPWFDAANAAVSAERVTASECPSSPVPRVYTGMNASFAGLSPNAMTTFTVATTDYFAISGASSATTLKPPSTIPPGYFAAYPKTPLQTDLAGVFGAQSSTSACRRLAETTDGLSNTMMIGEMSGRPWLFLAGGQQVPRASFPSYVSTGSINGDIPLNYGWGAWVHNNNFTVGTWSRDGAMQGGESAINCSNYRGMFSFHPNGACAAFGDGSVHILASQMSPAIFFALVTARANEVFDSGGFVN